MQAAVCQHDADKEGGMGRLAAGARVAAAAVTAAVTVAACGGGGGGGDTKAGWQKKHGPVIQSFSRDLGDAQNNINKGERSATLSSCTQVSEDAKEVRKEALPAPDPAVDADLRKALDLAVKAAADCLQGGRDVQARAVEAAMAELNDARASLDKAQAGINTFS
jgi:hypothetical protein